MEHAEHGPLTVRQAIDLLLPIAIVGILALACLKLLNPFFVLIIWSVVFAICFAPIRGKLMRRGLSSGRAATVIGAALGLLLIVPTGIAAVNAAGEIPHLVALAHGSGELHIPPPPAGIADYPVIGPKAEELWTQASTEGPAVLAKAAPKLRQATVWLAQQAGGILVTILGAVVAVVIAAVLLGGWERYTRAGERILGRISGDSKRGAHLATLIAATVRSVALGVVGVAFVQAALVGLGFFVVGIPGAGLLALVAMFLGIVQVPVLLVTLPAIAWAFSTQDTTTAIIFTVWSLIAGFSDAFLKPLLIGRGLEVPMPVILIGVIGGVIVYGLVGLFVGAVILAVGYVLFLEWLDRPSTLAGVPDAEPIPSVAPGLVGAPAE